MSIDELLYPSRASSGKIDRLLHHRDQIATTKVRSWIEIRLEVRLQKGRYHTSNII